MNRSFWNKHIHILITSIPFTQGMQHSEYTQHSSISKPLPLPYKTIPRKPMANARHSATTWSHLTIFSLLPKTEKQRHVMCRLTLKKKKKKTDFFQPFL